jgi:mRNA-degrading endonuclease toxin of MazEF toxin-antitoxin module
VVNETPGEITLDLLRAVDKERLKKKIGAIDRKAAENIKQVLHTMFS